MTNFETTTYSISEAAEKLGISEKTLRRWEDAGRFAPSRTLGNQRRYNMEDLQVLDAIKHNVIPHQKDLLDKAAAAQFLAVTERSIDRLVAEGKLHPFITVGTTYYPRHRLLPLLSDLKPNPKPPQAEPVIEPAGLTPRQLPQPAPTIKATNPPVPRHLEPSWRIYLTQVVITLVLITLYHLVFYPSSTPTSPIASNNSSSDYAILRDMVDLSTGSLTATTVTSKLGSTTPNLTLLPGLAPTSPQPGSLYYDANSNTLRIYTPNGWQDLLAPTPTSSPQPQSTL